MIDASEQEQRNSALVRRQHLERAVLERSLREKYRGVASMHPTAAL
jgi:hypothetical protein